jgi:hypothetical protein
MNKIRDISFVICIFLSLSAIPLGFIDLYYYYLVIILVFPLLVLKHKTIESGLTAILSYLLLFGTVHVLLGNNDLFSFAKVFISILVSYWFFYLIIRDAEFDFLYLFKLYYRYAFFTALIGLVQFLSFIIGFKFGYNYSWLGLRNIGATEFAGSRFYSVHSILGEPAAFAILISPAVYIAVSRLWIGKSDEEFGKKWHAIVIVIAYLLTQSSTGYMILLAVVLLINFQKINFMKVSLAVILLPLMILALYTVSPKFKDRLDDSIGLISGKIVFDVVNNENSANGSSLILFNHFIIAKSNALDHPFGTGLGSHHVAFARYNSLQTWFTGYGPFAAILNLHDANSLFSRILSEIGYVGVVCALLFIYRYFIRSGPEHLLLINHASLVILLAALLRGGPYFTLGLPFFLYCYYYTSRFSEKPANLAV